MRGPPYLIELLAVLVIWALLVAFVLYDTPRLMEEVRVTPSPSYWHYLDEIAPWEDMAHYE